MAPHTIAAPGQSFNRWTLIAEGPLRNRRWLCRCACGTERLVSLDQVRLGYSKGCRRCATKPRRHGMAKTPEYRAWQHMLERCLNPRCKTFTRYGGRGITVCHQWLRFEEFFHDMGPRPSPKHSLDRYPDNNGPYGKANCRWATRREQMANTRMNVPMSAFGETLILSEWARRYSMNASTLYYRVTRYGWPLERALIEPVHSECNWRRES